MNAQLQYRENGGEQVNVFPTLGGVTSGSSIRCPVALNISHRRDQHAINVNFTRSTSTSTNRYAYLRRRRRPCRHQRRVDRSVRLGRAVAVVLDVFRVCAT